MRRAAYTAAAEAASTRILEDQKAQDGAWREAVAAGQAGTKRASYEARWQFFASKHPGGWAGGRAAAGCAGWSQSASRGGVRRRWCWDAGGGMLVACPCIPTLAPAPLAAPSLAP